MSVPVTARLDDATVEALDRIVARGDRTVASRGALVALAVREWLARHDEEAIIDSYRRGYAEPDRDQDELLAAVGRFSSASCLGDDG